jgi:hypothetical protein
MYQERNVTRRLPNASLEGVVEWIGEIYSISWLRPAGFRSFGDPSRARTASGCAKPCFSRRIDVHAIVPRRMSPAQPADSAAGTMKA